MASTYETEFSNFPYQKITLHNFKNVDDKIASVINEVNNLRVQGLYNQAQRILDNNKDVLGQYIFDMETLRTIEEEIFNTQRYAKQQQQSVYFEEEEPDCIEGDVWVGGSWR